MTRNQPISPTRTVLCLASAALFYAAASRYSKVKSPLKATLFVALSAMVQGMQPKARNHIGSRTYKNWGLDLLSLGLIAAGMKVTKLALKTQLLAGGAVFGTQLIITNVNSALDIEGKTKRSPKTKPTPKITGTLDERMNLIKQNIEEGKRAFEYFDCIEFCMKENLKNMELFLAFQEAAEKVKGQDKTDFNIKCFNKIDGLDLAQIDPQHAIYFISFYKAYINTCNDPQDQKAELPKIQYLIQSKLPKNAQAGALMGFIKYVDDIGSFSLQLFRELDKHRAKNEQDIAAWYVDKGNAIKAKWKIKVIEKASRKN